MAKRKKFNNVLDTPIHSYTCDSLYSEEKLEQDLTEREIALFKHYALEQPDNIPLPARELIIKMAQDLNIIGFTEQKAVKKVGRPRTWKDKDAPILILRVMLSEAKNPNLSLNARMKKIAKLYDMPSDSLYARYYEVKRANLRPMEGLKMNIQRRIKSGKSEIEAIQDTIKLFETNK